MIFIYFLEQLKHFSVKYRIYVAITSDQILMEI